MEHFYVGGCHPEECLDYDVPPRPARLEKVRVQAWEKRAGFVFGPLRTIDSFLAQKQHHFRVKATRASSAALLYREDLQALMSEDPEAADILLGWLGRCSSRLHQEFSWQRHALKTAWRLEDDANVEKKAAP